MKRQPSALSHATALLLAVTVAAGLAACAPEDGAAMGGAGVMGGGPAQAEQAFHSVCPRGETTYGIDVSKFQSNIDWTAVAGAGVQFAFIRVSDGTGFPDAFFATNWAAAKNAGILRGTYQFFRSDEDPIAQADLLINDMGPLEPGDLPPVADVESTDGVDNATRATRLQQWLDHVEQATGVAPIIYTGGPFWESNVAADFSRYTLWHAGYTGGTCPSTVADQWPGWGFWQFGSTGTVAGMSGDVDEDNFNGTLAELRAMGVGQAVCGDGICSGGETNGACPGDCPTCEALPPEGGIISEDRLCFIGGGPSQFLRHVTDAGESGGLIWTHTTDSATEANFATWNVIVTEAGHYRIEAFTDAAYAQSHQAAYVVHHGGVDDTFTVDQTLTSGWTTVADDVALAVGDGQFVHVGDNTGEPGTGNVQLVFDALRLTRLDAVGEGEGEGGTVGEGEGEGAAGGEGEGEGAGVQRVALIPPPGGCSATPSSSLPLGVALLTLAGVRRLRGPRRQCQHRS